MSYTMQELVDNLNEAQLVLEGIDIPNGQAVKQNIKHEFIAMADELERAKNAADTEGMYGYIHSMIDRIIVIIETQEGLK